MLLCSFAIACVEPGDEAVVDESEAALATESYSPSEVARWVDVYLDVTAAEVTRNGARPTIISRATYIVIASMFQAWAAYDAKAVGPVFGQQFRRPRPERTDANRKTAISFAAYRAMLSLYPADEALLRAEMSSRGLNPDNFSTRLSTPAGVGNVAAAAVIESRRRDGSNAAGNEPGSIGGAYSDYTGYQPVNTVDQINDPDRWQPITFTRADGTRFTPSYLTPHWGLVRPFGLDSSDQFRPPPPPLVGSEQLEREVAEVLEQNADLTLSEKAIVEYMRDGPNSVSQSGQWLGFGLVVSRRDHHRLDRDMKMFFGLAVIGLDTFIASWEAKRFYDSSRPWTLVRHLYANQSVRGWKGPGQGTGTLPASQWHPYSPSDFITPPFPGYVSGHSTVSGGSARFLELFTGSDFFGVEDPWTIGSLTEPNIPCYLMQQVEGQPLPPTNLSCQTTVYLPTFTDVAEEAGYSRILGGFHIQADNIAGLVLGRQIAQHNWNVLQNYYDGSRR